MPSDLSPPLNKPTLTDICRVAGVSLATVDRVLNQRPGVREKTIEKVNKAIEDLGYVRDAAAVNLARRRFLKLIFIVPDTENEFIVALRNAIDNHRQTFIHQRTEVETQLVPQFDGEAITRMLDDLDEATVDGVAVFGPETPSVRDAVRRTMERGISVVSLVSDLPSSIRKRYIGIDNIAAGKTAARLMGRFIRNNGRVLVITGSRLSRDHIERRHGFDTVMEADFPHLEVVATIEGRDDPEVVMKMLPKAFATYEDIQGIYSSAGGNPGLIQVLKETGLDKKITVIAHELTPNSRSALEEGVFDAIISQDTGHLVRSATRVLMAAAHDAPLDTAQERIRIDIYLPDNMPTD